MLVETTNNIAAFVSKEGAQLFSGDLFKNTLNGLPLDANAYIIFEETTKWKIRRLAAPPPQKKRN